MFSILQLRAHKYRFHTNENWKLLTSLETVRLEGTVFIQILKKLCIEF